MENEKKCCCSEKTTIRSDKQKKALLNRLKRIEGQVRGIQSMLENDAYCNDVLMQSAAVNAAMHAFNRELLASHIRTCVARDIRAVSYTHLDVYKRQISDFVMRTFVPCA